MKELTIHYSVDFRDSEMRYHGDLVVKNVAKDNVFRRVDTVVSAVKLDLVERMKRWGFAPADINKFEVYFYDEGKEIEIFKFEK